MKSYTIPAAPGTYLIDDDGDLIDPVIAWNIGADDDGTSFAEPITPYEKRSFAHRLMLPDGKVWEDGNVFDSQSAYRDHVEQVRQRLADRQAP